MEIVKRSNTIGKLMGVFRNLVKGGFFHILLGNTLIKTIGFISSIVIVNLVTKSEYAHLGYSDNLYMYIDLFSGLGLSSAILKYCSCKKDLSEDVQFLKISLKYGILVQLLLSILLSIGIFFIDIPFIESKIIIWSLVFYPVLSYIFSVIQNYNRSHLNNELYSKSAVIHTLMVFLLSYLLVRNIGIAGIVFARYFAIIVSIFIASETVRINLKKIKNIEHKILDNKEIKQFFIMGISLMVSNMLSMIMPYNETFLINNLVRDEIVSSNYKIAMMIPSQMNFITGSIMVYFFPIISQITDKTKRYEKIKKIGFFVFVLMSVIGLIGILLSPTIIKFAYGESYMDTIGISYVFWIVYSINSGLRMVPMNLLPALGIVKFNVKMSVITCIIHLVLDYIFISRLGINGAAYASLVVYLLSGIFYWIYMISVNKNAINKERK